MTIIRAPRKERDFLILSNSLLQDPNLTMRALGLLCRILSKSDGWKTNSREIAKHFGVGRDYVQCALRELEKAGYIELNKSQDQKGRWSTQWIVHEEPINPQEQQQQKSTKPEPDFPAPVNPTTGKGGCIERTDNEIKKHKKKDMAEPVCVCVDLLVEKTGMPEATAVSLETRYGEWKVRGAIELLKSEIEKGTPIRSKTAWIKTALKEGWEAPSTPPITEPQKTQPMPQSVNPNVENQTEEKKPMNPDSRKKLQALMGEMKKAAIEKKMTLIGGAR